jgi:NAD(P)-dependent dehydrogenase (short-subunit alcohol dehydrogenase family)
VARYREDCSDRTLAPRLVVEKNWLVTGGARGITHESALALGQRYGAKLCLLGRTPRGEEDYRDWSKERVDALKTEVMRSAYHENQKPDVAWGPWQKKIRLHKALARYEQAGVEVEYHECDVSDARAVAKVVADLRERGIRIGGVLHGAGVEHTCRLSAKTLPGFHETVKPKSLGVLSLLKALRDEPVKQFVAFGSLVGVFGGVGQADYAMANESLRTLLREFAVRRPRCRFLTIHWPGWEEVGMASRPESQFMLKQSQLQLMPVAEGVRHFLEELVTDNPESEIVIAAPEELGAERLVIDNPTPQAVR